MTSREQGYAGPAMFFRGAHKWEVTVMFYPEETHGSMWRALHQEFTSVEYARAFADEINEFLGNGPRKCWALRSFVGHPIEGFERPDGKRFTITAWWRARHPGWPSALEGERMALENVLDTARAKVAEAEQALATLAERYVDWEDT